MSLISINQLHLTVCRVVFGNIILIIWLLDISFGDQCSFLHDFPLYYLLVPVVCCKRIMPFVSMCSHISSMGLIKSEENLGAWSQNVPGKCIQIENN